MAEVIDLNGRQARKQKRRKARAMRRAQAVAGALSCGMCPHRCARCGVALEGGPAPGMTPWPMCPACHEEYLAYKRLKEGLEDREAFWHTQQWAEMWRSWLEFMQHTNEFRKSAAFTRLIQEIRD